MQRGHRTGPAGGDTVEAGGRAFDTVRAYSALLRMQGRGGRSGAAPIDLGWTLRTMALVCRIQRSLDEAEINGLPEHLVRSMMIWRWIGRDLGIELRLDVDHAVVAPHGSVTLLARAVHDLITNCFERAFAQDGGGQISLTLARDGHAAATITIHDQAAGRERRRRPGGRSSVGARIGRGLAENAGAVPSRPPATHGGTTVRLRFSSPS